jgi:hypothetical protein
MLFGVSAELARGFCILADGTAILCRCMGMYNLQAAAGIPWGGLANLGQGISSRPGRKTAGFVEIREFSIIFGARVSRRKGSQE